MFNVSFLNNYYAKLCHELLELFNQKKKKMLSNSFRESTYLVVGTGTLVNTGVFLFLKVFDTTNDLKWLISNGKNYRSLLNFSSRIKGNYFF